MPLVRHQGGPYFVQITAFIGLMISFINVDDLFFWLLAVRMKDPLAILF